MVVLEIIHCTRLAHNALAPTYFQFLCFILINFFDLCYGVMSHMFEINIVHVYQRTNEIRANLVVFECPLSALLTFDLLRSLYFRWRNVERRKILQCFSELVRRWSSDERNISKRDKKQRTRNKTMCKII